MVHRVFINTIENFSLKLKTLFYSHIGETLMTRRKIYSIFMIAVLCVVVTGTIYTVDTLQSNSNSSNDGSSYTSLSTFVLSCTYGSSCPDPLNSTSITNSTG